MLSRIEFKGFTIHLSQKVSLGKFKLFVSGVSYKQSNKKEYE